ncbi:MAG: TauD/TfdA family dioxygenase [Gammaproteobacteria bacterium]|jgi:taurine dioxygenase|nr:TauD/TfdA family dioxygenase [Gammaproteobacteria bacterium]
MRVKVLEGVGAEVSQIDLNELADSEIDDVKTAFAEHGLLFFRDQDIDEQAHLRFSRIWGDINVNRFFDAHPEFPEIAVVSKEPDQTFNIGGDWHTDHSYDHRPALGSVLVSRQLPASGGDTWFTSMYKAYDGLSAGLQSFLESLRAVHSAKHVFGSRAPEARQEAIGDQFNNKSAADELEDPVHPVVIRHPLSGRKALFVNSGFTLRFEGWTEEESAPLLEMLYAAAIREPYITRFNWQPGSVVFWDNRATWHFAQNDYQGQRRVMHRTTIEGGPLEGVVGIH